MKRNGKLLKARNQYIVDKINQSESIVSAVHEISTTLFISERTVYRVIKTTDTIIEKVNTGSFKDIDFCE
jgi:hypothetical protein